MTAPNPVPATTDPAAWSRICREDEAARLAGQLTDKQYWARVHARDTALRKLPAKQRAAINSYAG